LISKNGRLQGIGEKLLRDLEVGKKPMISGKGHSDSRANMTASLLWHWLNTNARTLRLPPIMRNTLPVWFEVGWRGLLAKTRNEPHVDPYLKKLGKLAGVQKRATSRGMPEQTPAMERSDATAKIKELVKKSFLRLFGHLPH
jgi:hypothetical protein